MNEIAINQSKSNPVYPIEKIKINFKHTIKSYSKNSLNKSKKEKFSFFKTKKKIKTVHNENISNENNNIELIFSSEEEENKYLQIILDFIDLYPLAHHEKLSSFEIHRNNDDNIQIFAEDNDNIKTFVFYLFENDLISKSAYEKFDSYLTENGFNTTAFSQKNYF